MISQSDFARDVAALFQRLGAPFSSGKIASLVETLKLIVPQQQNPARHLIGFRNGVLDTRTGLFSPHCKENWLRTLCEVDFTPPVEGKRLKLMPRHSGAGWTGLPDTSQKNATLFLRRYLWCWRIAMTGSSFWK